MPYKSPLRPLRIPACSLFDFVFERSRLRPHRLALVDGATGRTLTYGGVITAIRRVAAGLAARGFGPGRTLALFGENTPEWVIAFFAVALAGGTVTTISALSTEAELLHQLRDSDARFLISARHLLAKAVPAALKAGGVHHVCFGRAADVEPFGDLLASPALRTRRDAVSNGEVFAIPYSSGTTGVPKGVMLTQYGMVADAAQLEASAALGTREVFLATAPFYHAYGMLMVMTLGLRAGATIVTMPRFEIRSFLRALQKYRVTTAHLVPPVIRMLAKNPVVDEYDRSSLRTVFSAAAPLPESDARLCADRNGCEVRQAYGMTECLLSHMALKASAKPGGVGVPLANCEYRVVDVATGSEVPQGALGEIHVRGPQMMKGYLANPEATARILDRDGWLHTGDIGYADADSSLFVVDRARDLVKFRGLQYGENELLLAVVEDTTARREAIRRVNFQALLLDSVRESVVAVDLEQRVTFWNKGAEAMFGHRAEEAIGRPVDDLITPPHVRTERDAQFRVLDAEGRWQGHTLRRRRDGTLIWTDLVASSITDVDGNRSGFVAIHRDVTELRRHEEEIRHSREELRSLASRLIAIREEERSAISRELHDELGQIVTRLRIDLAWLMTQLPQHLRTERTASILPLIDKTLNAIKHTSAQLRPPILDEAGIEAAIEWQMRQFASWNRCRCRLDLRLPRLTPDRDRDTAVFRILQEALTNVARHANASTVVVRGRVRGDDLIVRIEDDGRGLSQGKKGARDSLGLVGMRERAEAVKGVVEVGRGPNGGTVVAVRVPLVSPRHTGGVDDSSADSRRSSVDSRGTEARRRVFARHPGRV
jgi:PAS domain S-box-containing protein